MICKLCEQPMIESGGYYFCGNHEPPFLMKKEVSSIDHPYIPLLQKLPTPIALTLAEFFKETNPFLSLHRLTDAAEMVTRFFAIVSLSNVYQIEKEFPEKLRLSLMEKIERPTFGAWIGLADDAIQFLAKRKAFFMKEMLPFWKDTWKPFLLGTSNHDGTAILSLRNKLAHGGRLPDEEAEKLYHSFSTKMTNMADQLTFLQSYLLLATDDKGNIQTLLQGLPDEIGSIPAISEQTSPLESIAVYIKHDHEYINLFPLQYYDIAMVWSESEQEFLKTDSHPSPMIYMRYNKNRKMLEFTSFGKKSSFSQKGEDLLQPFLSIYNFEDWRKKRIARQRLDESFPQWDFEFMDILSDLTQIIVGRSQQIKDVKGWVKEKRKENSCLWVTGKPGVGKSAFMAKLALDFKGFGKKLFVIPFFFRAGDIRCSPDQFYHIATLKLAKEFGLTFAIKPNEPIQGQFLKCLDEIQKQQILEKENRTILFLLDGLDELGPSHESFFKLPFKHPISGCLWVCASRPEYHLKNIFMHADQLWDDGELPSLQSEEIRELIEQECEMQRYELYKRDEKVNSASYENHFIDVVMKKSQGLPLYIHLLMEDIKKGKYSFYDENELPNGLEHYYDSLLERLKTGDLTFYLNYIFSVLCWAYEPLTKKDIGAILEKALDVHGVPGWQAGLYRALEYGSVVLKQAETSDGEMGWTIYHDSFRNHLRSSSMMNHLRHIGLQLLLTWCMEWEKNHVDTTYPLRHYAKHLYDAYFYYNQLSDLQIERSPTV
ncbi:NACHT domain-containing protein [Neobacillus dielmonensis]|uniref:NACHT domain-containing protein n=1 Tax=Neobacillus dielmonensis TaxID=1347369 RepID=UPI0005A845D8|nr:NACHT domain-containing protein [Neobacillus dielmonensis]